MIFLARYWKYLAGLAVLGAIFYAGAHWQSGRDAAKAAVVAARQAERDAVAADAYAKATNATLQAERAAQAVNWRIENELEPKLAASTADAARLARRLRDALAARPGGGAVPEGADNPQSAGTSGVPSGTGTAGIEAATADALASCTRDSARLTALQSEIRGQL